MPSVFRHYYFELRDADNPNALGEKKNVNPLRHNDEIARGIPSCLHQRQMMMRHDI